MLSVSLLDPKPAMTSHGDMKLPIILKKWLGQSLWISGIYWLGNWAGLAAISFTGSPTDLTIAGAGRFVVRDPDTDERLATRCGHFSLDEHFRLVTSDGWRVQGFAT